MFTAATHTQQWGQFFCLHTAKFHPFKNVGTVCSRVGSHKSSTESKSAEVGEKRLSVSIDPLFHDNCLLTGLTKVSSLRATLMLLLDKKERDRRLHKEISRTDCWGYKKKKMNEEKMKNVTQDWSPPK